MSGNKSSGAMGKGRVGELTPKEHEGNWGVTEMFILTGFVVNECIYLFKFIKTVDLSCMEDTLASKDPIFRIILYLSLIILTIRYHFLCT